MIYSQCEIEKNSNYKVKIIEHETTKKQKELHDICQKEISQLEIKFEDDTINFLKIGREKKIDTWEFFVVDINKVLFSSTSINNIKRSDIVKEIHEWCDSCKSDVFIIEYNPAENEKEDRTDTATGYKSSKNSANFSVPEPVDQYPASEYIKIFFEDKNDAVNFKLTWG